MAVEVERGAYIYHGGLFFSHNPLHDLESLWWVGVWFLLCHYQPSKLRDIKVQQHIEVVKEYGETLFNNNDPLSRRNALTGPDIIANIESLSFPKAVQGLMVLLESFRDELVKYYETYKPMASQDRSFFNPDLYDRKFGDIFEDAKKGLGNDQTGLWPLSRIEDRIRYLNAK